MTTLDKTALEAATAEWLNWTDRTAGEGLADHLARAITAYLDALSSIPEQGVGRVDVREMRNEWDGNLHNCPYCAGLNVSLEDAGYNGLGYVRCADCNSHGPEKSSFKEAAEAWNYAWVRAFEKRDARLAPSQPAAVGVTDEMVERAEAAVYPRHERGFLSKPLIDAIDMRKALEAALRSTP